MKPIMGGAPDGAVVRMDYPALTPPNLAARRNSARLGALGAVASLA
jgi:hypothetical protein